MSGEPITKVTLDGGRTRYRVTLDIGADPATGRRRQRRATFDTLRAAREYLAQTRSAVARGEHVERTRVTLSEHLDSWLSGRINMRPNTRRSYDDAMRPWRERLGAVPVADLRRQQIEQVRDDMLNGSLRKVGLAGTPLSPRSVRLSLQVLQAALELAVRDGLVPRNIVAHVERPTGASKPGAAWTSEQAERFLQFAATDRLHAAWLLSMHGLRRGEVLGLQWSSVDFEERVIHIHQARVDVAGEVLISGTKTARGDRTLPVPDDVDAALRALQQRQVGERLTAGDAYDRSSDWVVVNEFGSPWRPEAYTDAFHNLVERAGLPRIRLHDARHTSVTLKRSEGWPDHFVALWHGHDESVMRTTYTHSYLEDLRRQTQNKPRSR